MTLVQKQQKFAELLPRLIGHALMLGYKITLGEAHRPQWVADRYAVSGAGISNSLHTIRLAIDINLFKDNKFLTKNEDYRDLGLFWESLSTLEYQCVWGGRFGDGNHFSIEHNGVK